MINRYLLPCRHCGGTIEPDQGIVERVGHAWRGAHLRCAERAATATAAKGWTSSWLRAFRCPAALHANK